MELLIMGPPGAGKGTQARGIAEHYGVPTISTGVMFRTHVAEQTDLGRQVDKILSSGGYVPDDLTVAMVEERLNQPDAREGFLLDGFPRTLKQVEALDAILQERGGEHLDAVLSLECNDDEIVERLVKRAEIEGRVDDSEEIVRERLRVYHSQTEPLLAHYRQEGLLVEVNGLGEIDDVARRITDALDAKLGS